MNFSGKGYGDNPKYIAKEILKRKPDYKIVWATNKQYYNNFPDNIKLVPYGSIKSIYEEVTSRIWIDNCRKQLYVRKRESQFYIQTWHDGPCILKKIEKDAENTLTPYYVKQAKHDSQMANLFLSCSALRTILYKSSFWYNGKILECGSPRDDIFINQDTQVNKAVHLQFSLNTLTKIVLYAPTFRNIIDTKIFDLNYQLILDILKEKTREEWVFLVRLHPNISEKATRLGIFNESVINATDYGDMQELLYASDILMTDYSGCMFEFTLTKKPVFLYFEDFINYKSERDFYLDIFSLPFPIAQNIDELVKNINNFNNDNYTQIVNAFLKGLDSFDDGKASERVADRIIEEINK
jgi:CDP-glycerol glycerophosphotransferase